MIRNLQAGSLSTEGFYLTPHYNHHAALPDRPEREDCLFNPDLHPATLRPQKIGAVYNRVAFSGHGYDSIDVGIGIKAAQSDIYYIPRELAPFREAIQFIINAEHNTTSLAFSHIAQLAVRHNVGCASFWHFDTDEDADQGTRTYNVADIDPTEFMDVPLPFNAQDRQELGDVHTYKWLLRAVKSGRDRLYEQGPYKVYHFEPYEISRHFSLTYHRAGQDISRTLVSIFYCAQGDFRMETNNPMIPEFSTASLPPERAGQALRMHRDLQRRITCVA